MKATILGKQRKTGSWEKGEYDNTYVHVCYVDPKVEGMAVECVKVKTHYVPTDLKKGDEVEIVYNRYGGVEYILKKEK